ncbi:MAG: DUF5667 domain-containing protein [Candidatus Nealsonbacteria bacterium]
MKIFKVFLLSFGLLVVFGLQPTLHPPALQAPVSAQEETTPAEAPKEIEEVVMEAVNLDENIQPEDLGVGEPRLLPDNPFYFLKNWVREIQSFFTFDPVKKAELRMKFANEKLMETKKIIEKNQDPKVIKKATENYQQEVGKIKNQVDKIREKSKENPRVESFLDKFLDQQVLHQKLLQRLETQVPLKALEKIKTAREQHLERFKDVMLKLEDRKEKITEKLGETLEKQKGSQFKNFKNLEILKNLEEKVPEEAKEAIRKVQENLTIRLKEHLEKIEPEDQKKFQQYLEKISGEKEKHLEILENLKEESKEIPEIKKNLLQSRNRILEQIREKTPERDCPIIEKSAPDFCKEGRIVVKRDAKGCIISFECVIPAEVEILQESVKPIACITLWNPVCGKDGKTYSNACFAKLAKVEIDYKGKCKEKECQTDADCLQPRCGPAGTIEARCIGIRSVCKEGKCVLE